MLTRAIRSVIRRQDLLVRRLSTDGKPPRGFEKFYRKVPPKTVTEQTATEEKDTQKEQPKARKEEEKKPVEEEPKQQKEEEKKQRAKSFFSDFDLKSPFRASFEFRPRPPRFPSALWLVGGSFFLLYFLSGRDRRSTADTITFQDLMKQFIEPDQVKRIIIHMATGPKQTQSLIDVSVMGRDDALLGRLKIPDVNSFLRGLELEQMAMGRDRAHLVPVEYEGTLPGTL